MQILNRKIITTPYGRMIAMATGKGLSVLEFEKPGRQELLEKRLKRWFPGFEITDINGDNKIISAAEEWLKNFFAGEFAGLTVPPLDMRGTVFELKVWQALLRIPLGKTVSYRGLAEELGVPGGSRAVGGASRRNPVSIIVPCHRVIGSNGSLVGYGGGIEMKRALLAHEGALAPLFSPPRGG